MAITSPVATYDTYRGRWSFLYDSYLGGTKYRNPSLTTLSNQTAWRYGLTDNGQRVASPSRYVTYLVAHPAESEESFATRLALSSYINFVSTIVDAYAEAVTTGVNRVVPDTMDLSDVDGRGSHWGEHVEEIARWDATYGCFATLVDTPHDTGAKSRADEIASGAKPYVTPIPPTAWAWVDVDSLGRVREFAFVDDAYVPDVMGYVNAQTVKMRIRVWTLEGRPLPASTEVVREIDDGNGGKTNERTTLGRDVGSARWEIREGMIQMSLGTGLSAQRAAFGTLVDAGPLAPALIEQDRLPVVFSFFKRVSSSRWPLGMALIDDAADIARSIYNKLSWEDEIHRKAGFPFLAIPSANTGGQLDPQTRTEIGPDKALPFDGATGAPQWIQPSSESSKELRESCVFRFMLALRTCGLEVAADQSAQVQSGEALRIRSRDFESRAKRFAANMQRYETQTLELMALLGGVDTSTIAVSYPKRFTLPDQTEDLKNALLLLSPQSMPVEIGTDAKVRLIQKALDAVLSLNDEDMARVLDEVRGLLDQSKQAGTAEMDLRTSALRSRLAEIRGKAASAMPTDGPAEESAEPEAGG